MKPLSETHPSLNNYWITSRGLVQLDAVQKDTVDKEVLRKAIEKLRPRHIDCPEAESYDEALRHLLKELGLEENE